MPSSYLRMPLFLLAMAFLIGFVQIGLISVVFDKLGAFPASIGWCLYTQ
jgi:hypothetical protein